MFLERFQVKGDSIGYELLHFLEGIAHHSEPWKIGNVGSPSVLRLFVDHEIFHHLIPACFLMLQM